MSIRNFVNIITESASVNPKKAIIVNETIIKESKSLLEYLEDVNTEESLKPLSQSELPVLFKNELPNLSWHHIMDLPQVYNQLKPISDRIFGHLTTVPFPTIYVVSTITDSDIGVHGAVSWIKHHGAMVTDRIRYDMKSFAGHGEVFRLKNFPVDVNGVERLANVSFLIMYDKHGEYIFSWVNEESLHEGKSRRGDDNQKKDYSWKTDQKKKQSDKNKRFDDKDEELDEGKSFKKNDEYQKDYSWQKKRKERNEKKSKQISGEDEETLNESISLIDMGYMKHPRDINGLEKYLKQMDVIPKNGHVLDMMTFEKCADDFEYKLDVYGNDPIYGYYINLDERGDFSADVRDEYDYSIFEIHNEEESFEHEHEDVLDEELEDTTDFGFEPDMMDDELTDHFEALSQRVAFGYLSGYYTVDGHKFIFKIDCPDFDESKRDRIATSLERQNIEGYAGFDEERQRANCFWHLYVDQDNPIAIEYPSTVK